MAQNTELQERYGSLVEAKLRATSIFDGLFNHRYEGQPKAGAVKIPVRAEATASAYDISAGCDLSVPSTSYETLVLDNDFAVNELVDGYCAAAVPDGMVAERLDSAGYALSIKLDTDLINEIANHHTNATTSATDEVKAIIETLGQARAAKVNPDSIWVVVSPESMAKIYTSDYFIHNANQNMKVGQIGTIMGAPVMCSNHLTGKAFVVGNSDYCHLVNEWQVPVSVNDLYDGAHIGASAVQGRIIYGYKISKPSTVFVKGTIAANNTADGGEE